jgi:bacterioferritin-associated ferredoxin
MVCHCLQITEEMIVEAVAVLNLSTLQELRACTGAGDGCTACHKRLRGYLERGKVGLPVLQSSSSA